MNDFYVYEWIRLDTNEPFYVGKGRNKRAYTSSRNPYFNRVINKIGIENVVVVILHDNLSEKLAHEYEIYYISVYKYELGFNLTNMTDGGEGIAGYRFTKEQRITNSLSKVGKKQSPLTIEKRMKAWIDGGGKEIVRLSNVGRKRPEEEKKRISKSCLGKKKTEETKKKMSLAQRGLKKSEQAKKNMSLAQKNRDPKTRESQKKAIQKKIICITTNEVFDSKKEAEKYYGHQIPSRTVINESICKGKKFRYLVES